MTTIKLSKIRYINNRTKKYLSWFLFSHYIDKITWDKILYDSNIILDLDGFFWLKHDGLLWINFIMLFRYVYGLSTNIILPTDIYQIKYLKYIGFDRYFHILDSNIVGDYMWSNTESDYSTDDINLLKLKDISFVNEESWQHVQNEHIPFLRDFLSLRYKIGLFTEREAKTITPFTNTMCELLSNITQHGGSEDSKGMGFISFTPPSSSKFALRLCFSDIGDGFKSTLFFKENIATLNDRDAIFQGLLLRKFREKEGVEGLYPTLKFIRERSGLIGIRCGKTFVQIDLSNIENQKKFDDGYDNPSAEWLNQIANKPREMIFIPGTHIYVELR